MSDKDNDSSLLFILSDIKEDIKNLESKLDDRWDEILSDFSSHKEKVHKLEEHAEHTKKIIFTGNGKPSITNQVLDLQRDVAEIKQDVKEATDLSRQTLGECQALKVSFATVAAKRTPKEVTIARWKAFAVFLGLVTAVVSALAAYLA